jgi:hypothetical protein
MDAILAPSPKRGAKKGKKSRKYGRNFRWDYVSHAQTKYRAEGHRAKNKARHLAQRKARLAKAAANRARKAAAA